MSLLPLKLKRHNVRALLFLEPRILPSSSPRTSPVLSVYHLTPLYRTRMCTCLGWKREAQLLEFPPASLCGRQRELSGAISLSLQKPTDGLLKDVIKDRNHCKELTSNEEIHEGKWVHLELKGSIQSCPVGRKILAQDSRSLSQSVFSYSG